MDTTIHFSSATDVTTPSDITSTATDMLSTSAPNTDPIPHYWGYIGAGIAVLCYGSGFSPVKKFETGDGMFFQWIMCCAILVSGVAIQLIRDSPKFYPIVMLGGTAFVTGNVCVVPIVKTIGLGLGLCIWGMVALVSGWATGRFGLFGVNEEIPDKVGMNYAGVCVALSSAVIFAMVKGDVSDKNIDHTLTVNIDESSPLISHSTRNVQKLSSDNTFIDELSPSKQRIVGLVLCLASGLLYGQMFTPSIYVQDRYTDSSQEALDYVFAFFCGIFATSTIYFLVYAALMKNTPRVYPRSILPGFVSGVMWSVGTAGWMVANKALSVPVAFPIVSTGPAIVASLLGIFVFKEIRGSRNIFVMCCAFAVTLTGVVLTALSKT